MTQWVATRQRPEPGSELPPERHTVLVWLANSHLPFCGYIRYSAGDRDCPYWVVYHGNPDRGSDVIAWCDCLPDRGPPGVDDSVYRRNRSGGAR